MNIFATSSILASIYCLLLSLFVWFRGRDRDVNKSFAIITSLAGIWTLFPFLAALAKDDTTALLLDRIVYFAAVVVPATFLDFVLHLIKKKRSDKEKLITILAYLLSFMFFLLNFTPFLIKGIMRFQPQFYVIPGPLYLLFVAYFGAVCLYAFIKLIFAFRIAKGAKRNQLKYVFIAFVIAYISGLMHFLPAYFGRLAEPFPHDILLIGFASIISYAILQHRLLDIEIVIKRTAVYSILTALLTGLFISVILLGNYLLGSYLGQFSIWFGVIAAFIIAFLFQPLRDAVQKVVDNLFFRARYDYQRMLGKYSYALSQPMTDLDRFSHLAPYLLTKHMKLSGASVMVLDRAEKCYRIRAGVKEQEALEGTLIPEDSPLIKELYLRRKELNREEIQDQGVIKEMEELKAVLIIPCISKSEYFKEPTLISTINLGKKLSDEAYSREDIDFLKTMANTATISIEYAFILEELKRNQEQIVKSEKMAALGSTTAGIAHELKNPLTYLLTVAQSMGQSWDNPVFKESVVKMFPSEVERMKLIVDGLSDYSKTHELRLEPVDVTEVLDKVLAILGYEIKKNNVYVIKNFPEEKAIARADKNRLVQVFMNIVANAVQAMGDLPAGRQGKRGDLNLTVRPEENEIRISIADTGPGIPEEQLHKIFDPFFTTKESGTGLGLSITKKIIEEHQGAIYVSSKVGEGTTFTVCLPRA